MYYFPRTRISHQLCEVVFHCVLIGENIRMECFSVFIYCHRIIVSQCVLVILCGTLSIKFDWFSHSAAGILTNFAWIEKEMIMICVMNVIFRHHKTQFWWIFLVLFFYNVIDRVLTNPPLSLSLSHTRWLAPCANEFTIKIVWLSHGTTNNNTRGLPANKGHVSHRQIDRRAHHHHQP